MSNPDEAILGALMEAGDIPVSGEKLAEALGISRVAIWARLDRLRKSGFPIRGVRREGYRLEGEPEALSGVYLRACLNRLGNPLGVLVFPEIDSTNSEAERQLAAGRETPFAIVSDLQTQGRGRLGRVWHSPAEGNLYISLVFRPRVAPSALQAFTLAMGVALAEWFRETWSVPVAVKWPNDLYLEDRKLAGMLTEARIDADLTRDVILGFGLNLNSEARNWSLDGMGPISLRDHLGKTVPRHEMAAALLDQLSGKAEAFFQAGDRERAQLVANWPACDYLAGRTVEAQGPSGILTGVAEGIDEGGRLKLRHDNELSLLSGGDVSVRPFTTAPLTS